MGTLASALAASGILGLFVVFANFEGMYGLALFVASPAAGGALAVLFRRPRLVREATATSLLTGLLGPVAMLAAGLEGAICLLMAFPLSVGLAWVGGMLAYPVASLRARQGLAAMCVVLAPLTAGLEKYLQREAPLREVRTAVEVNAPPEAVWPHVIAFPELGPPEEWLFQTGIAYPMRARIEGRGAGAVRYCEFSTGPFVEPVTEWEENRKLAFRVTSNPRPMEEWSPWGRIDAKHLEGYFVSERGQFVLTALPGNRTRLEGTTWYRNRIWPSGYWGWWSDAIIHRIHERVLRHVARLSQ